MAMAPCPECKKKISTNAQACPHCGNPVTEDVHAQWKADATAKQAGCGLLIVVLIAFGLYGWMQDSMTGPRGDVKDVIMEKLAANHPHIKSWAGENLYEGTAVLINDQVGFWVKDGTVYATNGLARQWAPLAAYSPPSVSQFAIEEAIKGDGPKMPPNLGINYIAFYQDVAAKVPQAQITKDSYLSYKFDHRVHVEVKEAGGQLTYAYIGFYTHKGQNKLPLNIVHAAIMVLHPDLTAKQAGEMLNQLIKAGLKDPGSTYTNTFDGVCWDFSYGEKKDMNFTFRPEK
ncbi:hypothetical protein [Pseudodesulfovibrio sp.]|uniref:zinc ribbon domain-containing protein n=1 Tax=unclassified Pseudodesulfovibrio TaxID=2661612 RepID=UPI003B0096D8